MTEHPLKLPGRVRDDLRAYADERDMTYSEALEDILPEPLASNVIDRGETVVIRIDTSPHSRLDELTGDGVDYGDVVAHYLKQETDTSYE